MANAGIGSWVTDPYLLVLYVAIVGSLIVATVGNVLPSVTAMIFKSRRVSCPETGSKATISLSVRPHQADRIVACSLAPDGLTCSRNCVKGEHS